MIEREPTTTWAGFSSDGAVPTERTHGRRVLEDAELYWLSSVRPDGRPHVTPLLGIWLQGAMFFCTGADERTAKNLMQNPYCILTTGCNGLGDSIRGGDVHLYRVVPTRILGFGKGGQFSQTRWAFS